MDALTARPRLLKQASLSLIYYVVKTQGIAARAEIVSETGVGATAIRSLLAEMTENGETGNISHDVSSDGRKAERYRLNPDRYYGVAFCITNGRVHGLLVSVYGEVVEVSNLEASDGNYGLIITACLGDLVQHKEIKSIGVGVSGVVEDNSPWSQNKQNYELSRTLLGDSLARRYDAPVTLEGDLNAIIIDFCRCYAKEFPGKNPEDSNMAYLHFGEGYISAGFTTGGRVIRGCSNFASEISLIPTADDRTLAECMVGPMGDKQYISFVIQIISWICGALNPQYALLGGPSLRKSCVGLVSDTLVAILPKRMFVATLYSPDVQNDYYDGVVYLTAGKVFNDIQFIKEPPH